MNERLQKIIANAGIASRRHAEELITSGKVKVNGQLVKELGVKADPSQDKIEVEGKVISMPKRVVYALNKPAGVVSTRQDPDGRRTVISLVPQKPAVYPVGRLDRMTEGLILLTNDGELALKLTHPRYEHQKEYELVGVSRLPIDLLVDKFTRGTNLKDGFFKPDSVHFAGIKKGKIVFRLTIHEGKTHLLRRYASALGFEIVQLIRVRIGGVELGELKTGAYRQLNNEEITQLTSIEN